MARRFVVGTAGHVDHGKTTLVHALTGIDTDRLPEEKRRGITIELGFAGWQLDDKTSISLIDVPGHRRLVHTMIAGATGIELVLLVVAADEGVMPQTREHLAACELLGIRRAVVAVTKIDRVERDLAEMAGEEVSELCAGRFEHEVVLCSAKTGEGLDALRAAIARALAKLEAPDAKAPARLSVDRAFSVKGAGTVVTGTLVRGALATGDVVRLVGPAGARQATVRGLHVHDRSAPGAEAPTRLAVNLASVALEDVARGDLVTSDPGIGTSRRFDAELVLLRDLKSSAAVDVYVGTARAPARLQILGRTGDEERPRVLARLRMDREVAIAGGDRFVVRASTQKASGGSVIGGGVILDAAPGPLRDRKRRRAALEALGARDATAAAKALVFERAPRALLSRDLASRFILDTPALLRAAEKLADRGDIVRIKDEGFVDRGALTRLAQSARAEVARHHAAFPFDPGLRLETLRQKLGERCGAGVAAEAIRLAAKKSLEGTPIIALADVAKLEGFVEGRGAPAGGPIDRARSALEEAALKGMGEFALTEVIGQPPKEARAILAKLVRDGEVVATGGQWFLKRAIDDLRSAVTGHLSREAVLTIAQFKEMSGLGRKQAIP
ncbi:MAG: selenocysteine-specific translation elongation factor, partial [Polyangiaceae bacterium]|nr:selenocysteine-specific translation elongation factor [Polyangiaceae bacterium]